MRETKFKQTEIGKIPEDWEIVQISDIVSSSKNALAMGPFGSNITKDNFVEIGVPVIRGNNMTTYKFFDTGFVFVSEIKANELKSATVRRGDIVITHRGTLGQVGIIPNNSNYERYIISQSGMKLTCNTEKVAPEFIFYYLKSNTGQQELLRNASQTGVPAIAQPLTSLKKVKLPLPSLPEQLSIASILSSLDSKIELNNKMNKTLEAIGQAIFKKWFVDFEFPDEKEKPYKSSSGEMIDSELGMIPKGWKVVKLKEVFSLNKRGISPKYKERGIPVINQKCIRNLRVIKEDIQFQDESRNVPDYAFLKPFDILINSMGVGTLGRLSQISIVKEKLLVHSCISIIRSNDKIRPLLLGYYFKNIQSEIESMGEGTTGQTSLKNKRLDELNFILPKKEIQNKINLFFENINFKIDKNIYESQTLSSIRDALLLKLMSGEIRVK